MAENLFPYLETCSGCSGYGRDREGSRCSECGGNGVGPQGGTHPRTRKLLSTEQTKASTPRTVWPHMDALVKYDPLFVHRHGDK